MNLENRVETLEHEFKILKNEIEETLLEIQNQVLIHYYPALRAEDSTPPQEILRGVGNRNKATDDRAPEASPSTKEMGKAVGAGVMHMQEISLTDHIGFAHESELPAQAQAAHTADLAIDPSKLSQLSMWSTFAVERIGKAEALQMVESCTEAVGCTPAVQAALRQLIVLCRSHESPPKVDTAVLMDVFLKLHTLFAEVAGQKEQEFDQPDAVRRDNSDG